MWVHAGLIFPPAAKADNPDWAAINILAIGGFIPTISYAPLVL